MLLYVNGSKIDAGAKTNTSFEIASDDFAKVALGNRPHPDNIFASWGYRLSQHFALALRLDACDQDNLGIINSTNCFLDSIAAVPTKHLIMVISWLAENKQTTIEKMWQLSKRIDSVADGWLFVNTNGSVAKINSINWGDHWPNAHDASQSFLHQARAAKEAKHNRWPTVSAHNRRADLIIDWLTNSGYGSSL